MLIFGSTPFGSLGGSIEPPPPLEYGYPGGSTFGGALLGGAIIGASSGPSGSLNDETYSGGGTIFGQMLFGGGFGSSLPIDPDSDPTPDGGGGGGIFGQMLFGAGITDSITVPQWASITERALLQDIARGQAIRLGTFSERAYTRDLERGGASRAGYIVSSHPLQDSLRGIADRRGYIAELLYLGDSNISGVDLTAVGILSDKIFPRLTARGIAIRFGAVVGATYTDTISRGAPGPRTGRFITKLAFRPTLVTLAHRSGYAGPTILMPVVIARGTRTKLGYITDRIGFRVEQDAQAHRGGALVDSVFVKLSLVGRNRLVFGEADMVLDASKDELVILPWQPGMVVNPVIYKDSWGVRIDLKVPDSWVLSQSTGFAVEVYYEDGSSVLYPADVENPLNHTMRFQTTQGMFPESQRVKLQGVVDFGPTVRKRTKLISMRVM